MGIWYVGGKKMTVVRWWFFLKFDARRNERQKRNFVTQVRIVSISTLYDTLQFFFDAYIKCSLYSWRSAHLYLLQRKSWRCWRQRRVRVWTMINPFWPLMGMNITVNEDDQSNAPIIMKGLEAGGNKSGWSWRSIWKGHLDQRVLRSDPIGLQQNSDDVSGK